MSFIHGHLHRTETHMRTLNSYVTTALGPVPPGLHQATGGAGACGIHLGIPRAQHQACDTEATSCSPGNLALFEKVSGLQVLSQQLWYTLCGDES